MSITTLLFVVFVSSVIAEIPFNTSFLAPVFHQSAGQFGNALSFNGEGTLLLVGHHQQNEQTNAAGNIVLFSRETQRDAFSRVGKFRYDNYVQSSDRAYFGTAVALSKDGLEMMASAPLIDYFNPDNSRIADCGSVYTFARSSVSEAFPTTPTDRLDCVAANDHFGTSLALSNDALHLVVGAPGNELVYAFSRSDRSHAWSNSTVVSMQSISPPEVEADATFGSQLALAGNHLVVSAPLKTEDGKEGAGVVYSFQRSDSSSPWSGDNGAKLRDAIPHSFSRCGSSLSLDASGSHLLFGCLSDNVNSLSSAGSAQLFRYDQGAERYEFLHELTNSVADQEGGAFFGWSVALSSDAKMLVVGAREKGVSDVLDVGVGFVWVKKNDQWNFDAPADAKLTDPALNEDAYVGSTALISDDSKVIALGALGMKVQYSTNAGGVFVYSCATNSDCAFDRCPTLSGADCLSDVQVPSTSAQPSASSAMPSDPNDGTVATNASGASSSTTAAGQSSAVSLDCTSVTDQTVCEDQNCTWLQGEPVCDENGSPLSECIPQANCDLVITCAEIEGEVYKYPSSCRPAGTSTTGCDPDCSGPSSSAVAVSSSEDSSSSSMPSATEDDLDSSANTLSLMLFFNFIFLCLIFN